MKLNRAVCLEIGKHFLDHLDMELKKDSSVMDVIAFDHKTPREITEKVRADLIALLPELTTARTPDYNLFLGWWEKNEFIYEYQSFALESYNIIFFYRIQCILEWSSESIEKFHTETLEVFEKFDYKRPGFAVSDFLNYENNMRELLREIILSMPQIDHTEAWDLIYSQSKNYQAVVNEFFEKILQNALQDSERLLHNILPVKIATELKEKDRVEPVHIESATVLFTDFKGFTQLSEQMSPTQLIKELDECFSIFDTIIEKYNLEKIKTIGDSYMCAGGVPEQNKTHTIDCALAALEMRDAMNKLYRQKVSSGKPFWQVRIGFHTGDLTAGVIGTKKFSYDIWGDTVNTASRMESSGLPGQVNVSKEVFEKLHLLFQLTPRGAIAAKNKGEIEMYVLEDLKAKYKNNSVDISQKSGNAEFWEIHKKLENGARLQAK